MPLIIPSKKISKNVRKKKPEKKVKYHLSEEIKTSVIEWLNVMLFLDKWMIKCANSPFNKFLKNIITMTLFLTVYINLELKHYLKKSLNTAKTLPVFTIFYILLSNFLFNVHLLA